MTIRRGKKKELANLFVQHVHLPCPAILEMHAIPYAPKPLILSSFVHQTLDSSSLYLPFLAENISQHPHNPHLHTPSPSKPPISSAQKVKENSTYFPRPQSYSPLAYSSSSTPPSPSVSTCSDDRIRHLSHEPWFSPRAPIAGICRRKFRRRERTSGGPG